MSGRLPVSIDSGHREKFSFITYDHPNSRSLFQGKRVVQHGQTSAASRLWSEERKKRGIPASRGFSSGAQNPDARMKGASGQLVGRPIHRCLPGTFPEELSQKPPRP